MHTDDVRRILKDPRRARPERLLRLQGLRDEPLAQGLAAGWSVRLGPAACAVAGAVALVVASPVLYLAFAGLGIVGAVAPHHPVEMLSVVWARGTGRTPPPANRAARRSGCLAGAALFALAALGLTVGPAALYWAAGLVMVLLPAFVAATNVCVPSLVFTLFLGADRATCPTLTQRTEPAEDVGSRSMERPHADRPGRTNAAVDQNASRGNASR
jgi:hypothetical protein